MAENRAIDPADVLSVRSRVSWPAIIGGALIAFTLYMVLTMLGLALGVEAVVRGGEREGFGSGAAIYSLIAILIAFFFGGWATTRLAVGESKLEAVLHAMILWGLLFMGLFSLLSMGVRSGFGGIVGLATSMYGEEGGGVNLDALSADLKEAGVPSDQVDKVRSYYEDPESAVSREGVVQVTRKAAWWSLIGIVVSLAATIVGGLMGSGELLAPVPLLGVRRTRVEVRRT